MFRRKALKRAADRKHPSALLTPIYSPDEPGFRAAPTDESTAQSLPPGTRLLEYQIERVLGHGGFGITYLARDTQLNKPLAIKEYLPPELALRSGTDVSVRTPAEQDAFDWGLRQFVMEAKTLARFSHRNLVPVYRFFEANETAYIVMGYVEGETLGSLLNREPALSEERLRGVLLPVMDGLEVVHGEGVLHRDIKPDNIIIRREDHSPVLIDFGAARFNLGSVTCTAMRAISAGYAPLEQYGESANQGPWTDIYALGALAYRAVSGRKPPEAINRVHDDRLVSVKKFGGARYSAAFLDAVNWALTMNAEERPRSIAELRQALNGVRTREQTAPASLTAPTTRRWALRSAAAVALFSVGLGIQPAASLQGYAPVQEQTAHAPKILQMASVLMEPVPPAKPKSRSRPKATEVVAIMTPEVAPKAKQIHPELRITAIEELPPIHRRQ